MAEAKPMAEAMGFYFYLEVRIPMAKTRAIQFSGFNLSTLVDYNLPAVLRQLRLPQSDLSQNCGKPDGGHPASRKTAAARMADIRLPAILLESGNTYNT